VTNLILYFQREKNVMPPLSPTSMSPFFSNPATKVENVTEIFNEGALLTPCDETSALGIDKMLSLRRHTVGPGQKPVYAGPALQPNPDLMGILPQTNLMQNLPLVCNLPPESFSVKDPHLLKPPLALLGVSPNGRRASDGGGYYPPNAQETNLQEYENQLSPGVFLQPDFWNGPPLPPDFLLIPNSAGQLEPPSFDTRSEGGGASRAESPNHHMVEQYLKSRGQTKRHTIPESPRKRRTGLHTVMEKPPTINPELVEEVETRIRTQSPVNPTHGNPHLSSHMVPKQKSSQTSLTPVLEVGKLLELQARDSLHPPSDRYSPVRRSNEAAQRHGSASSELSPPFAEGKFLQDDILLPHMDETQSSGGSLESGSSGYMSSQFHLRPPSPCDQTLCDDSTQPRRASDSGVRMISSSKTSPQATALSQGSQEGTFESIQQLYNEMYNTDLQAAVPSMSNSRRYSYPNSPVHVGVLEKSNPPVGLSEHLQHLKLQKKTPGAPNLMVLSAATSPDHRNVACESHSNNRWKGSITQGVPSRTTTCPTEYIPPREVDTHSLVTPTIITHSQSFDETLAKHPCIPGTLTALWNKHQSASVFNASNEVSFTQLGTSAGDSCLRPGICLTNVTGDEILLYGSCEPMDQSN
jgi:hypothetical protein